ncbi:hypothetical protein KP509_33G031700 [Ceratopteris richardii]|uniref:Floricaula/leafy-like transcription factor n=1 Tax=Ceratopteris richardii TaxID=49495 RepID=A0A8T2QQ88_CERRI|nr:hypothetical protein KP509_33G031700 [Ceratopteris richardii]
MLVNVSKHTQNKVNSGLFCCDLGEVWPSRKLQTISSFSNEKRSFITSLKSGIVRESLTDQKKSIISCTALYHFKLDPEQFASSLFRWEQRAIPRKEVPPMDVSLLPPTTTIAGTADPKQLKLLEDLFKDYGVRSTTIIKVMEMGFTVNTLVNMMEQEIDDLIKTMTESYHMELLVGEKYGLKSAIRAEKKRQEEDMERQRLQLLATSSKKHKSDESGMVVTSLEGTREQRGDNVMMFPEAVAPNAPLNLNSKDHVQQEHSHAQIGPPGLLALPEPSSDNEGHKLPRKKPKRRLLREPGEDGDDRTREHPFIVTEPGEVARGKKNGLDYLFDLYEQCARFLDEVQQMARERGEKCPTKVTNQVFRHAKLKGASYINKPKMRHYVHCYALHCLDKEKSNFLRKQFKERGENVGAWRQACYYPLVDMARDNGWDIEGVFARNEKLRIWYVPTRLRQLCHLEKSKDSDSCIYD